VTLATDAQLFQTGRTALMAIGLLGGSALIAGLVPFEGAVIGSGTVMIEGNVKKVQHQTGGVIGAVLVKEGAMVREGDVVARLDDTMVKSNLGVIMADLTAQTARSARLLAERDDAKSPLYAQELVARAVRDKDAAKAIESETILFERRRTAREGQKAQLRERINQFEKEVEGFEQQLKSTQEQQTIAVQDRAILEPAHRKGFVQRPRITALDREIERNKGLIGDATARIAQSRGRIREVEVQIVQIDRERVAESTKELNEAQAKMAELAERRLAAEDQLRRVDIKAPVGGMVHELAIHTVGGVINPGETLMLIVPDPDNLVVEVKVAPNDRDQIKLTKGARVRFTSFNQRLTPELAATVSRISGTTTRDQQTGFTYYTIGLALLEGQLARLNGEKLAPGMMADTFITTDRRTMLEFLTKQFFDYWGYMFRSR
jgi:HlyD family secretion protein